MSLQEKLSAGSYKGVSFLTMVGRTTGGVKDVKHSFPNSNTQTIENLGKMPRVYSMELVITGEDYYQARDALLAVIEEGTRGPLVHPTFGRVENIVARTFTLNENLNALGDGRISVVFELDDKNDGVPQGDTTTLSNLADRNLVLQAGVNSDIAGGFRINDGLTGNFTDAAEQVNEIVESVTQATESIAANAEEIDEFSRELANISENVFALVKAPQELADSLGGLYATIDTLYPSAEATTDALRRLFGYGEDDAGADPEVTTAGLAQRVTNREILRASVNMSSLGYAYENAVQVDYETTDQVETVADALEAQYQSVLGTPGLSDTTKTAASEVRVSAQAFFNEKKLTTRQIIEVETTLTSARLLSFQYYGTSDDGETLALLNNAEDVAFIEGTVKVLTA